MDYAHEKVSNQSAIYSHLFQVNFFCFLHFVNLILCVAGQFCVLIRKIKTQTKFFLFVVWRRTVCVRVCKRFCVDWKTAKRKQKSSFVGMYQTPARRNKKNKENKALKKIATKKTHTKTNRKTENIVCVPISVGASVCVAASWHVCLCAFIYSNLSFASRRNKNKTKRWNGWLLQISKMVTQSFFASLFLCRTVCYTKWHA